MASDSYVDCAVGKVGKVHPAVGKVHPLGSPIVMQASGPEDGRIDVGWNLDLVMDLSDGGSVDGDQGARMHVDGAALFAKL